MDANDLSIKSKKSQACVINYKLRSPPCDVRLTYCNDATQISDEIKYLGVLLNEKLNFLPQIHTLETRLSRDVIKTFVLIKTLKILAYISSIIKKHCPS